MTPQRGADQWRSPCINGVPTSGAAPASRLEVTPCNQPIDAGSVALSSRNARSAADADVPQRRLAQTASAKRSMEGGPVDELLDVIVERPVLDQLQVEVGRTLEDRVQPGLTGDDGEERDLYVVD
jgi:hypothetical protein